MPRPRKYVAIDIKTIKSMMRDFGIYQYTLTILKQLLRFNYKCVSVIFKDAKLSAKMCNRKRININDLQKAILNAPNEDTPVCSRRNDTRPKPAIIDTDISIELINDKSYKIFIRKYNRQLNDTLPDLGYFDIEEFIRSIQVNQDTNENKFDVDSLLNDPRSL